ncbi:hypothetical protein HK100_012335 [Physocladia obscura]|uniref:alpha-1,2-Mannosidase n=1 Tax=Physocladia obscura TaxID=109957 RepID=A0AAD5XDD7_9FUNG|nr:hypothetical protein HK100_012335 [Physocladia obscura]
MKLRQILLAFNILFTVMSVLATNTALPNNVEDPPSVPTSVQNLENLDERQQSNSDSLVSDKEAQRLAKTIRRTISEWRVESRREEYRLKTKEMFYHGLVSYMELAHPKDELMPLSGAGFDTLGNFSLTLIDALDTLIIMRDTNSFAALIPLVAEINLDINVNVSVFETCIRVLGGLLSAHVMAVSDPFLRTSYDFSLLEKAQLLGYKLLPAFDTPTGLPYGTINLLHGVSPSESTVVCTACATTFSIEFSWLSLLTDDPVFEQAARKAVRALWKLRSKLDLVGNHVDVISGEWVYGRECTIGGLVDSFYEYLLKASIAFSDEVEYDKLFVRAYKAVKIWMKKNDWHVDVNMDSGQITYPYFYSLGAFWPGVKILAGDVEEGVNELNAMSEVLRFSMFMPEALSLQDPVHVVDGRVSYPLRPEYVESLWYAYRATRNPTIVEAAFEVVDRLNNFTRTKYGFANVADVRSLELEDKMESFFLAETLKYLYLIFDVDNEYNTGNYVFNIIDFNFLTSWGYHFTIYHPIESDDVLSYLNTPDAAIPQSGEIMYRGDDKDKVYSGFSQGMCWKDDWIRGKDVDVNRWIGGLYQFPKKQAGTDTSGNTGTKNSEESKKKQKKKRRKIGEVYQ